MSQRFRVRDQNGDYLVAQQGESCTFKVTFTDLADPPTTLTQADILSLDLTLFDDDSGTVLNSRIDDDVSADLAADGTLTLKLDAADNAIVNAESELVAGDLERHIARLTWTWNDGATRTGIVELAFDVEMLKAAAEPEGD